MLAKLSKQYFTFIKGLITEASPLTFPEGASLDELNFKLNIDGSRQRRLGLDYEEGYDLFDIELDTDDAISLYEWTSARLNSTKNYVVVQAGATILFYEDTGAVSANKETFSIDLTDFKVSGADDDDVRASRVDMTSGKGALYIVGRYIEPLQVTINEDFDTLTITSLILFIRDFKGAESGIGNEVMPEALAPAHEYNLLNAGWSGDWIATFFGDETKYPSRNMVPWLGILKDPGTNINEFNTANLLENAFGDTTAASGKFVVQLFNTAAPLGGTAAINILSWTYDHPTTTITMNTDGAHGLVMGDDFIISGNSFRYTATNGEDRGGSLDHGVHTVVTAPSGTQITFLRPITAFSSDLSNDIFLGNLVLDTDTVANPSGETEEARPECTAFFSGRVWYAGIDSINIGSTIYFSQIVERDDFASKCYQAADPTSQYFTEIVDTDGGAIVIGDIDTIRKMVPYGNSLLVFAKNGVWQISPGQTGYFRPSDFGVRKITSLGLVSPSGICFMDNFPTYASDDGLIAISQDPQAGFLITNNITETTIQSLYNAIPKETKPYIHMAYEPMEKKLIVLYSNTAENTYQYDYQLTFDMRLKAFYLYNFPIDNPYVGGVISRAISTDEDDKLKYFAIKTGMVGGVTFAQFWNTSFRDWYTFDTDGTDAAAYLVTGYELGEAAYLSKYAPVVHVFLKRTETEFTEEGYDLPSSCNMQARWDWADHTNSGKFGTTQEVYRFRRAFAGDIGDPFNNGNPVVVTRNKVRGRGKSLHLRFSTTENKDCHLYGWSVLVERETRA